MSLIVNDTGRAQIITSVFLPHDLIVEARSLRINRSALFRRALEEEITKLRAEAPQFGDQKAPATPLEAQNDQHGNK